MDVWAIALAPGDAVEMHVSFIPVGHSGAADWIHLLPIAAPGYEQVRRIGGVYAWSAPDFLEESILAEPGDRLSEPVDCDEAVVDGQSVAVRLCEERNSLVRVFVFRDGTVLTGGSAWRQTDLYRLDGVGEFRLDIEGQLEDAGPRPAVVLLWHGSTGSVPEAWVAQ